VVGIEVEWDDRQHNRIAAIIKNFGRAGRMAAASVKLDGTSGGDEFSRRCCPFAE